MLFTEELQATLSKYNLLNHEFYKYWNEGKLNSDTLKEYAIQYYPHVSAFPRNLSAIHSLCESREARKIILENLVEEEYNDPTHPDLWLDFARELGVDLSAVENVERNKHTKELLEAFSKCTHTSYEMGLGALYAHEWQYSGIAKTKAEGLAKFYNINEKKALEFFKVHSTVDVWHREQIEELISKVPEEKHEELKLGVLEGAKALWGFLDGMLDYHKKTIN